MKRLKIGICLESLGLPLRRALLEAERMGVTGVQVNAAGDLAPNALSQTGRRELRHLIRSHNMELTALGCPLRRGLDAAEDQEGRIEHVMKVLALSFDLGPRLAIVQAGHIPEAVDDPRTRLLTEALLALTAHGDKTGTILALETGLESGQTLGAFLDRFDTGSLRVNLDPGNLLMNGFDPAASIRDLRGKIVHMHATDARASRASPAVQSVPLGQGDIEWMGLLSVLEEVEYHGWVVVEREIGDDRLADVANGVTFLRRLIGSEE